MRVRVIDCTECDIICCRQCHVMPVAAAQHASTAALHAHSALPTVSAALPFACVAVVPVAAAQLAYAVHAVSAAPSSANVYARIALAPMAVAQTLPVIAALTEVINGMLGIRPFRHCARCCYVAYSSRSMGCLCMGC